MNVGFREPITLAQRPFGLEALARYQIFPPEFLDFVRRVVPAERHDSMVYAVEMTAVKGE
jgi:hypothetical protein